MTSDPDLLALPACQAMAEKLARELHPMVFVPTAAPGWLSGMIGANARLLSDLSRPESRDAWMRKLRSTTGYAPVAWRDDEPAALKAAILEVFHE